MADIPQGAIDAAERVLIDGVIADPHENTLRPLARQVLEAAEQAWPHDPPQRSPESTTAAVTERSWARTYQPPGRAFGFGPLNVAARSERAATNRNNHQEEA